MRILACHRHALIQLAFSPDGQFLASIALRDPARIWRLGESTTHCDYPNGDRPDFDYGVTALAFAPNSQLIAMGRKGGTLDIAIPWKNELSRRVATPFVGFNVTGLSYLNDGRYVAVSYADTDQSVGTTRVFDANKEFKLVREFAVGSFASGICALPASKTFYFVEGVRRVSRCDLLKSDLTFSMPYGKPIRQLAIDGHGAHIAVAHDYAIDILNADSLQRLKTLLGHQGRVDSLVFLSDGRLLSGSWDKTVRLWDIESGRLLAAYDWQIGGVRAVAVSPDGVTAAAGGDSGAIVLWDVDE
jgi:WD40 repeat protein